MNPALKSKLQVAIAGGAMAVSIAGVMLSGKDGLEGREYVPYNDVGGVLTVCDGHTGKDIIRGKKYSDSECDAFLKRDLEIVAKGIDPVIAVTIPETTRAALYSFTYNVGVGAFKSSTLLRKLNAGDTAGACDELHRWIYAAGKPWKGLQNRRDVEHAVCSWQTHPVELVVENGELEAVEAPIPPDHANWFVAIALTAMAAVLTAMAVILWRMRNLIKSHDRDPRPDDSTDSE